MSDAKTSLFGLDPEACAALDAVMPAPLAPVQDDALVLSASRDVRAPASFSELPAYKQVQVLNAMSKKMGVDVPFFSCHERIAKEYALIGGEEFLNYSTYDYLGLNGHPRVVEAAVKAIALFGTSAGASRLVSGERPIHRELEGKLAALYGTEAALVFVSGHATNVSTLATLMTPSDIIYHDALAHDSIVQGALLSGAQRCSYAHNDCAALETVLQKTRSGRRRAIIATEGLFSMDGSIADLPRLIALKKAYNAFLMVDEAHALGVLGATGKGSREYFGTADVDVDIWMGTLSKTLCGCGGFIAGCRELIEVLRYKAPGFVYSVGMSPPLAAASSAALDLLLEEPHRVRRLAELSAFFLREARKRGLNTGYAEGYAVIPVIVGSSLVAGVLSAALFKRNINVMPIIFPVVEEGAARLRFFLSAVHSEANILKVLDIVVEELKRAEARAAAMREGDDA
ncbi:MAG: aminotransferase class I/II-fold pyridoxal phosphate-dependent enzyme [Desulfovibrio sp.]|jgi:8-amino-7-oxononanoate synthase|nr:aminotransferase class I/II-fold pyridoxal phosphate-dependent enzyme [Desulfovibrio sp.]